MAQFCKLQGEQVPVPATCGVCWRAAALLQGFAKMPSGLRQDTDTWQQQYDETKELANDILNLLQERNLKFPNGGQGASRATAICRRKLGSLGTALDALRELTESDGSAGITENEKNRRRDLVSALRTRREDMLQSLKRDNHRAALLQSSGSAVPLVARETETTAALDNRGILQLQQTVMRQQDEELEDMERTINSTRHIALTVNEELSLQERLLDDLEEDVDVAQTRMRAASKRLQHILNNSGNCKCMCLVALLVVVLVFVIAVAFKLLSWLKP